MCGGLSTGLCSFRFYFWGIMLLNNAAFNKLSDVSSISVIINRNLFF